MKVYPGQTVTLSCKFTLSGLDTDPDTVSLVVMDPESITTTYTYALAEISKTSTGDYSKEVNFDMEGTWRYRWVSTGAVAAATEGEIEVKRSPFV